jgi:hypothetical protein
MTSNRKWQLVFFVLAVITASAVFLVLNKSNPLLKIEGSDESQDIQSTASNSDANASFTKPPQIQEVNVVKAQSPLSKLLETENLFSKFLEAQSKLHKSDPQLVSLYMQIRNACEENEASRAKRSAFFIADKSREWATIELDKSCASFDFSKITVDEAPKSDLIDMTLTRSPDISISMAKESLSSANNAVDLILAGEILLSNNALPLDSILGEKNISGYPELSKAWQRAALLRECQLLDSCGPKSFTTITFCSINGCRQGQSLQDAMMHSLSPREYQATIAFNRWIVASSKPK